MKKVWTQLRCSIKLAMEKMMEVGISTYGNAVGKRYGDNNMMIIDVIINKMQKIYRRRKATILLSK